MGLTDGSYSDTWSKYSNQPLSSLISPEARQFFQENQERYQQAAELQYREYEVPVENGVIQLTPTLQRHGVVFYEIRGSE